MFIYWKARINNISSIQRSNGNIQFGIDKHWLTKLQFMDIESNNLNELKEINIFCVFQIIQMYDKNNNKININDWYHKNIKQKLFKNIDKKEKKVYANKDADSSDDDSSDDDSSDDDSSDDDSSNDNKVDQKKEEKKVDANKERQNNKIESMERELIQLKNNNEIMKDKINKLTNIVHILINSKLYGNSKLYDYLNGKRKIEFNDYDVSPKKKFKRW